MKTLLILILFVSTKIYAQNVVEHVPPDFKYDKDSDKVVPFEPEFEYDCYLELAKDLLHLWREYEKWCYNDSTYSCQDEFVVDYMWAQYSAGHNEYICKWRHKQPGFIFEFMDWIENTYIKNLEQ